MGNCTRAHETQRPVMHTMQPVAAPDRRVTRAVSVALHQKKQGLAETAAKLQEMLAAPGADVFVAHGVDNEMTRDGTQYYLSRVSRVFQRKNRTRIGSKGAYWYQKKGEWVVHLQWLEPVTEGTVCDGCFPPGESEAEGKEPADIDGTVHSCRACLVKGERFDLCDRCMGGTPAQDHEHNGSYEESPRLFRLERKYDSQLLESLVTLVDGGTVAPVVATKCGAGGLLLLAAESHELLTDDLAVNLGKYRDPGLAHCFVCNAYWMPPRTISGGPSATLKTQMKPCFALCSRLPFHCPLHPQHGRLSPGRTA
jgi:hypothetical protein